MEAEEACESERAAKNKVDEQLKEAQGEITELRNTTGTLKLQLKYTLNEKELCEYKLTEERTKVRTHGVHNRMRESTRPCCTVVVRRAIAIHYSIAHHHV